MCKHKSFGISFAVILIACLPSSTLAAVFANGSFENGQNVGTTLQTNSTDINSWKVYFGNIDYVPNTTWQPAAGDRSIDLNGLQTGGIAQQFDVNALHEYQLSFSLSGNPDGYGNFVFGARGVMSLTVYPCSGIFVNLFKQNQGAPNNCDSNGATFSYDTSVAANNNTRANMKYATESLKFSTKLGQETLFFLSTTANSPFGPVIDNVQLTDLGLISDVPEPSSVLVLAGGLLILLIRSWRVRVN